MIQLKGVEQSLGDFVLRDIHLEIGEGEYFVIMGPSGAGKTLLLEIVAGLRAPDRGTVSGVEADALGFIYQDYMLFPHMNVFANVAYGMRARGVRKENIRRRVRQLAEELGIQPLLNRDVRTLSGGERQRVAIARALAIQPGLLLLDEPTAALDRANRRRTQKLLRELHARTGATFIQVTHDFEEALSLGDRVALIVDGRLVQAGRPDQVLREPACRQVADFMGYRNIFSGPVNNGRMALQRIELQVPMQAAGFAYAAIRSEDILLSRKPLRSSARNSFPGRVTQVLTRSGGAEVLVDTGTEFSVDITHRSLQEMGLQVGDRVVLTVKVSAIRCFEH